MMWAFRFGVFWRFPIHHTQTVGEGVELNVTLDLQIYAVTMFDVYSRHKNVSQYNETNVMHFSFNLLRIKGLYMFRALLAHPQEARFQFHCHRATAN
jgi:hypothetical protein